MVNEQIAELIAQGGNEELLPLLWENTRRLFGKLSITYFNRHRERCILSGTTVEDLQQESYFAMLEAVEAYCKRRETQRDMSFLSFCKLPFLKHAVTITGGRTSRKRNEPLNNCTERLGDSAFTDNENRKIEEYLTDENAEKAFEKAEGRIYYSQARKALDTEIDKLPQRSALIIRERYFGGKTAKEINGLLNISVQRVFQLERSALDELGRSELLREIYAPISEIKFTGFSSASAVEREVEWREGMKGGHGRKTTKSNN